MGLAGKSLKSLPIQQLLGNYNMPDDKLNDIVKEYAELAKDKNIDVASLMINALQQRDENKISPKTKRWAYLISVGIPPAGFLFALWFFFRDESDAKTTAYICAALTTFSLVLSIILFKAILTGSGTSLQEIQQIDPKEVYQLTQ